MDFANSVTGQSITQIGNENGVTIPDQFFIPGSMIHAWVVLVGEDYVVTRYHIMIPISPRAVRTSEEPAPSQQGAIDQAIAALNEGVERAEAAADEAEQSVVDVQETVDTALEEAKASGEFDGPPGPGVAPGGSTGQVLAKRSSADYDTEWTTPDPGGVTDVQVNGTSVVQDGVANIPAADGTNMYGVVKVNNNETGGIKIQNGTLSTAKATESEIKTGTQSRKPIVPVNQHESAFYGLAKAAGDSTQSQSSNPVGTYTPEAKGAIQQMLGISNLLAPTETTTASKAYSIGEVFTSNGKLYKATAAIAAADAIVAQNEGEEVSGHNAVETKIGEEFVKFTDAATINKAGVVKVNNSYGLYMSSGGDIRIYSAPSSDIKRANSSQRAISPDKQHEAVFYGLTKAAGVDMASSDNAVGTYTDDAKSAIRTMLGAVGTTDYATSNTPGLVAISSDAGIMINSSTHRLSINQATSSQIKAGTALYFPIVPQTQHVASFYGLAKASGDTTQSASSNAVGTYTDSAKASIKSMLGIQDGSTGTVDVTGTTPTITAVENTRYVCGEVATLSFTPPASGISIVRFTSGTTATVLTLPSTVKFPEWFDATALEADTIYELCVTDGIYGAVMSWAL